MRIVIPDDYQDAVRTLDSFRKLDGHHVTIYHDTVREPDQLVERFQQDEATYRSAIYNETQVRQEFIDPLFEALGCDIGNKRGLAAAHREVVLEYSMKIGDKTRAPDYLFRLDDTPRFFVEAKKPSVNLREGVGPAYQALLAEAQVADGTHADGADGQPRAFER